jgi:hypothetical protein
MFRIKTPATCSLALALLAATCLAEDAVPSKFYTLDFVVKEVEGSKVLNTRAYSMMVSESKLNNHSEIRTGSKVPYSYSNSAGGSQFTFLDVGVSIDCFQVAELHEMLSLVLTADISSVVQEPAAPDTLIRPPVVRQNKWSSGVIVPLKKPIVVFSSDDLTTKHQMQLELTATPVR